MRKHYIYLGLIAVLSAGAFLFAHPFLAKEEPQDSELVVEENIEPQDRELLVTIEPGQTFSVVSQGAGLSYQLMSAILSAAGDVYDLSRIRAGQELKFYFDPQDDSFKKMIYPISTLEELFVFYDEEGELLAQREKIDYQIKIRTVEGSIDSSLYQSALDQELDIRAIIELAEIFAWTVDFGMGIRAGDTYKFIFEERYRDGKYIMPGRVLAAKFVNDGRIVEGYYYLTRDEASGEEKIGYYHPDGASVQKLFLKSPVAYKYISSGYTTGPRYIAAFQAYTSSHMAIDYAAPLGTPVSSVGNGTVIFAGWNRSGYGNFISIRHNETFTTNYAHLQKIHVKTGQRVSQGDTIGTVGSTGYSTGPHLHYEMVKNGSKINPLTIELPSDKSVPPDKLEDFQQSILSWQEQLN
ncbi:MAG: peptidoglycan DD-metalloendopeptidase family protein [Patescibacteria group bacterium]|nr:peptidoglycan DD-metalloendopeptidase family protein [Patescibacteria group bacterium]